MYRVLDFRAVGVKDPAALFLGDELIAWCRAAQPGIVSVLAGTSSNLHEYA
jgi:hypothetical protein